MPVGHARAAALVEAEQVELGAELAVVALLGLFDHGQVGLQVLGGGEGRAVDALQHGAVGIAAPVGAGHGGQLDGLQEARGGQVRPAAEVDEVAVAVDGHALGAQVVDDLELVGFAHGGEQRLGLVRAHLLAGERAVGRHRGEHALLDLFQILGGEGALEIEIVVEAVLDVRADGHLGRREDLLDGLGHDVGGAVAQDGQALGGFREHGLDGHGTGRHGPRQVNERPVAFARDDGFHLLAGEHATQHVGARLSRLNLDILSLNLSHNALPHKHDREAEPPYEFFLVGARRVELLTPSKCSPTELRA